jgi:hypothetical protein
MGWVQRPDAHIAPPPTRTPISSHVTAQSLMRRRFFLVEEIGFEDDGRDSTKFNLLAVHMHMHSMDVCPAVLLLLPLRVAPSLACAPPRCTAMPAYIATSYGGAAKGRIDEAGGRGRQQGRCRPLTSYWQSYAGCVNAPAEFYTIRARSPLVARSCAPTGGVVVAAASQAQVHRQLSSRRPPPSVSGTPSSGGGGAGGCCRWAAATLRIRNPTCDPPQGAGTCRHITYPKRLATGLLAWLGPRGAATCCCWWPLSASTSRS